MVVDPPGDRFFRGKIGWDGERRPSHRFEKRVLYFVSRLVVEEQSYEVEVHNLAQFSRENAK